MTDEKRTVLELAWPYLEGILEDMTAQALQAASLDVQRGNISPEVMVRHHVRYNEIRTLKQKIRLEMGLTPQAPGPNLVPIGQFRSPTKRKGQ